MTIALRQQQEPELRRNLLSAIHRSGILSPGHLRNLSAVVAGSLPRDPKRLAARLVKNGTLTEYQARHLLHGPADWLSFGRYVILDRLGDGSMGRVYKARHRMLGHTVALKVISTDCQPHKGGVARFLREMRLVGRLDHRHIVHALESDEVQGIPYIAMDYVAGTTLNRLLLDRGPLPPAEVASYAHQAALGLAHAHERGVIHRDVKPSNLIVDRRGVLKVLDLGLGALIGGEADGSFATTAGAMVGTVEYMSPEAAAGRELDGRSDLYSLGCTMYHLLSGRVPFPGDSKVESLARRIRDRAEPLAALRPDVPAGLAAIVGHLMATRPEDRYPSGRSAATALKAFLRDEARGGPPSRVSVRAASTSAGSAASRRRARGSGTGTVAVRRALCTRLARWPAGLTRQPRAVGAGLLLAAAAACIGLGYLAAALAR